MKSNLLNTGSLETLLLGQRYSLLFADDHIHRLHEPPFQSLHVFICYIPAQTPSHNDDSSVRVPNESALNAFQLE